MEDRRKQCVAIELHRRRWLGRDPLLAAGQSIYGKCERTNRRSHERPGSATYSTNYMAEAQPHQATDDFLSITFASFTSSTAKLTIQCNAQPRCLNTQGDVCSRGRESSAGESWEEISVGKSKGQVRLPYLQVSSDAAFSPLQEGRTYLFSRIRRIKCDESRPACQRCASTGRMCDGYGIWGGGVTPYGHRSIGPKDCIAVPRHTMPVFIHAESTEEKGYFDWFRCRSSKKIPGVFSSSFWETLVFQASSNEPAVLHAVLAVSSVHKRESVHGNCLGRKGGVPDEEELFMLRQYSKAISSLQPHFSTKSRASVSVTLATCVVFICLEFLCGHYQTAQAHLRNGLNLLRETQRVPDNRVLKQDPCREFIDDCIIDALVRLHIQVELIQGSRHPHLVMDSFEYELPAYQFQSMNQARRHLHRLLDEIFQLSELAQPQGILNEERYPAELLSQQKRIRAKLASWLAIYKASKHNLESQMPVRGVFAYQLLDIYHTMADIMAHACLQPACESIFDSHTDDFVSIIMRLIDLRKISEEFHRDNTDMSKSIVDMGWIPPLYYTAIKCRIHRVRLQAIKLLASTSHREGIWDANSAACIARKVMEIEERDFFKDIHMANDFHFSSAPEERDFLLPTLPDSHRIHEVQVLLPDDPLENIVLVCRQRQDENRWKVSMSEYYVLSDCWVDREEKRCAFKTCHAVMEV